MSENLSSSWLLSRDYENYLPAPSSFFWLNQDKDPGQSEIFFETTESQGFISIQKYFQDTSPDQFDIISDNFNDSSIIGHSKPTQLSLAERQQSDGSKSLEMPKTKKGKKSSRKNGQNNIHKKFITQLNEVIPPVSKKMLKKKMKQLNQSGLLDPKKSSRYGFLCYLLNIKYLLGDDSLLQVYQLFSKRLNTECKSNEYYDSLKSYYKSSFGEMIQGNLEQSVQIVYNLKNFKQKKYKTDGIKYVKNYKETLEKLIAESQESQ